MPLKPKGYGKRGRPKYKDIMALKKARALIDTATEQEAYIKYMKEKGKETTPGSAKRNCHRMVDENVYEKAKELLKLNGFGSTNKEMLEKVLQLVLARWMSGEERTADMIAAARELEKLCSEFKDRIATEDVTKKSPEEIQREIETKFGFLFNKPENSDDVKEG